MKFCYFSLKCIVYSQFLDLIYLKTKVYDLFICLPFKQIKNANKIIK